MDKDETLTFKLDDFEGPLDLLLHLIKQSKMNIYDIQISQITSQYLEVIHTQKELQLNVAGEFLVMAAKLTEIKGKLLLPHDEEVSEDDDPREDLVDQLLEYQVYKDASMELQNLEQERANLFSRPEAPASDFDTSIYLAPGVKLADLKKAFQKVLAKSKLQDRSHKKINVQKISLNEAIEQIRNKIKVQKMCTFNELFNAEITKEVVVLTFMAILELAKKQEIVLNQTNNEEIKIKLGEINE